MGTDNQKRPTARQYEGDDAFLNDFWKDCETQVYQTADVIIFTNENQRTYMLASNGDKQTKERVMQKSIIMHHPILDKRYCSIITCPYVLDSKKINIGYFGSFYANRKHHDMLTLLDNYDVVLHLFVPEPDALKSLENKRVRVNAAVGHLEYLNIAAKMDYLYLNDIEFSGDPNPYLPSKLADYLTAGANIIAVVKDNSILSAYEHPALIKVKNTAEITDHLRKKS